MLTNFQFLIIYPTFKAALEKSAVETPMMTNAKPRTKNALTWASTWRRKILISLVWSSKFASLKLECQPLLVMIQKSWRWLSKSIIMKAWFFLKNKKRAITKPKCICSKNKLVLWFRIINSWTFSNEMRENRSKI